MLNENKLNFLFNTRMNTKYIFVVAAMTVTLIEATAFATDRAFAGGKNKYEKNQVISQAIECGNYWIPINIICYNLNSSR